MFQMENHLSIEKSRRNTREITTTSKSRRHRPTSTTTSTSKVIVPFKYLCNFWNSLGLSLMNCEVKIDVLWTRDCMLIAHHNNIAGVNFMITMIDDYNDYNDYYIYTIHKCWCRSPYYKWWFILEFLENLLSLIRSSLSTFQYSKIF